jgi:hypothetical protein
VLGSVPSGRSQSFHGPARGSPVAHGAICLIRPIRLIRSAFVIDAGVFSALCGCEPSHYLRGLRASPKRTALPTVTPLRAKKPPFTSRAYWYGTPGG